MNPNLSEIAIVLDRSGSMNLIREATIDGFNAFLKSQQESPGLVRLTLVQFDHQQVVVHDAVPVAEILPLNADSFVPRGSTALLDAIGDTIDRLGQRLEALPEGQRPGDVTVAILTDGEENSSRRFTWNQVSDRIQHQIDKYSWEFLYLGADADTIATAARLNIRADNSASYHRHKEGVEAVYSSMSRKMKSTRSVRHGLATAEERADSMTSMSDLLKEEEHKHSGSDPAGPGSRRPGGGKRRKDGGS